MGAIYEHKDLAPLFNTSLLCATGGFVGLSAIHALAFGVPKVLADDEPHAPEVEALIEGENCAHFEARNAQSFADRLTTLVADRDLLEKYGAAGAQKVTREFSISGMVGSFERAVQFACGVRGD
jgi:glycosyltransferase involved in cell wall biosynthesis